MRRKDHGNEFGRANHVKLESRPKEPGMPSKNKKNVQIKGPRNE